MKAKDKKRSPLNFSPLRVPGQSLDREIDDVAYDGLLGPLLTASLFVLIAGLEWYRDAMNMKPAPWIFTFAAFVACIYAGVRAYLTVRRLRTLKLGRDGERAVAQYLEWFRTAGFFVIHDVPNDGANIDHVLLGTKGLFTIETKTISKPERGECKVRVVDGKVSANGHVLDRDPLVQAKAQARWLSNFLTEARFRPFVQPVVVFPGWFVEPFDMKAAGVWVLEPKALERFIESQPERHSRDEVKAMASALSSYVRSKAKV